MADYQSVNDEAWGLLKDTIHSKSRLYRFIGLKPTVITGLDESILGEVICLYQQWLRVLEYFCDNYKILDHEFKQYWPSREEILITKGVLADKCHNMEKQYISTGTLALNHKDFSWMDNSFNWVLLAILSREHFKQFRDEFDKTVVLLKKFKAELLLPSA